MLKSKPVSRVLSPSFDRRIPIIYLGAVIADGLDQPTRSDSPESFRDRDFERAAQVSSLFGLSTRKVCRAPGVTTRAVGAYSTFSPFPLRTSPAG